MEPTPAVVKAVDNPVKALGAAEGPADLAPQPASNAVLRAKYLAPGETHREDLIARVAAALAQAEAPAQREPWALAFAHAMRAGFIPAGRVLAAAGRTGATTGQAQRTWVNCFVQPLGGPRDPTAGPPLEQALVETVATLRAGGGVGLNFSAQEDVTGALHAFDSACRTATGTDTRPGALMGVLDATHPALGAFVQAKSAGGLSSFNLSVAVDDGFMQRAEAGDAQSVQRWKALVHAAHTCGEPGVLFISAIQRDDVLGWRERIVATNPCAEQPLPPYGSCCLGSVDLTRCVHRPFERDATFDHAQLARLAAVAVRALDNVLTLTPWPLPAQREEALATRRIGLGFTGLASALALLGLRYDQPEGRNAAATMARTLRDAAVAASVALARERGPYPLFDAVRHLASPGFASRLPDTLRQAIARDGLRHSHLLSVAPAGSISLAMADGASSGIEPAWAWRTRRPVRTRTGATRVITVEDAAWRRWQAWRRRRGDTGDATLPAAFVTAAEIRAEDQLAMVAAVAPYVDASISKTVHLAESATVAEVDTLLRAAWRRGVKGLTVYRPNAVIRTLLKAAPLSGAACRRGSKNPAAPR